MPATRRTRAQTAKAASVVSVDTILLAASLGAGAAAYCCLDAAPEVVVASCVAISARITVILGSGHAQKSQRT